MVALPMRLLRRWLLPGYMYGRCLVAAVVLFVLQRWVGTRQSSVSEQQEGTGTVTFLPGRCNIKPTDQYLADGTKKEASEKPGGDSLAVRKVKTFDSPVRRSAQQCWRNAVISLPTGKVRRRICCKSVPAR